jgi:hypothetical protein
VLTLLSFRLVVLVVFFGLVGAALGLLEIGRRVGRSRVALRGTAALEGFGAVEGAVFALLGLLLAFTFSAAASRYDTRRDLIVQEANAIGTAYLRVDLLPPAAQPELRRIFGQYVDTRLAIYDRIGKLQSPREELARAASLQDRIWKAVVAGCVASPRPQTMIVVVPAINEMIDIAATRTMAARSHIPLLVVALLVILVMAGAALAGYGMARAEDRSWGHMVAFAFILAVTVYVILDYEFPRVGLIRLDWADQALIDVRKTMP